jgi:hypothetical protein
MELKQYKYNSEKLICFSKNPFENGFGSLALNVIGILITLIFPLGAESNPELGATSKITSSTFSKVKTNRSCPDYLADHRTSGLDQKYTGFNRILGSNSEAQKACIDEFNKIEADFKKQMGQSNASGAYEFESLLNRETSVVDKPVLFRSDNSESCSSKKLVHNMSVTKKFSLASEYYYFENHLRSALIENTLESHFYDRYLSSANSTRRECLNDSDPLVSKTCKNMSLCGNSMDTQEKQAFVAKVKKARDAIIQLNKNQFDEITRIPNKELRLDKVGGYKDETIEKIELVKKKYTVLRMAILAANPILTEATFKQDLYSYKINEAETLQDFEQKITSAVSNRSIDLNKNRKSLVSKRSAFENGTIQPEELLNLVTTHPMTVPEVNNPPRLVQNALGQGQNCFVARMADKQLRKLKADLIVGGLFFFTGPLADLAVGAEAAATASTLVTLNRLTTATDLLMFQEAVSEVGKSCLESKTSIGSGQSLNVRLWSEAGQCKDMRTSKASNETSSNCQLENLVEIIPALIGAKLSIKGIKNLKALASETSKTVDSFKLTEYAELFSELEKMRKPEQSLIEFAQEIAGSTREFRAKTENSKTIFNFTMDMGSRIKKENKQVIDKRIMYAIL